MFLLQTLSQFLLIAFQGAALLRMVQGFMKGQLEEGVIDYLNKYRYSNAKTEDLWVSLSLVSPNPNQNIF